jgi:hypothetical protein
MKWFCFLIPLFLFAACRQKNESLFDQVPSARSNIKFNNTVTENDSINPLDMEFLYNGGGVAVGDFNRDGKPDLYFTASTVSNKMYLNHGSFKFKDVTKEAGVTGEKRWCNAASVVDINNDGWQDVYVCASITKNPAQRTNLFYINQGLNKNGVPVFKELATEYNVADTGFSVHAAFFDYDRDGDLDMYLVTTTLALRNASRFDGGNVNQQQALTDKLFRNEGSDSLGHPYFKDVSREAGIQDDGYGLGIAIADINRDGWKDIYITNDFYSSDKLYINNGNGTFADKAKMCFKHTSQNAMGNDIADINNDGLADIIAVDMNPEDNYRKKKNMSGINYFISESMQNTGLLLQYVRNTLQLNNGVLPFDSGRQKLPVFSDISFYAGVAETDWSWNPSLADFDNDGFRDLLITNGYPKDVTDHDFAAFRKNVTATVPKQELLEQIPQIKIPNYAYRNRGDLTFENVTEKWGLGKPSFSNGAVYTDLDGDGDLDYVVNNINEQAFVFENTAEKKGKNHFLNLRFEGSGANRNGIGAIVEIYYENGKKQVAENTPYRGYLSTIDASIHFGLGATNKIDSIFIEWPDGTTQMVNNIRADQTLTIRQLFQKSMLKADSINSMPAQLFQNSTVSGNITFQHPEFDFVDYNEQRLLPHKLSQYGPSLAAGDVDGNGYDDLFIGAAASYNGRFLMQQPNGTFTEKELPLPQDNTIRRPEMMGVLLFDADGDGDLDLYSAAGSNEFPAGAKNYSDQFFTNDGKGNFSYNTSALPQNFTSKSCVKVADYDKDGDLDLFIGGRVLPQKYPQPVSSFIYRNDSEKGTVKFTDVTTAVAPFLSNIGLTCDAVWTDFDGDSWPDLVLAGEWMPLLFVKNDHGVLKKFDAGADVAKSSGWWNSLTAGDFDNDGDMDYVAGNLGLNSYFKASEKEPVSIYAGDLNNDGSYDAIPSLFLPDGNGRRREFPANVRDDFLKQQLGKRKQFDTYIKFAKADMTSLLTDAERNKAMVLRATTLASSYVQNNGNGTFTLKPLLAAAQFAPLNGMIAEDINSDGNLDLVLCGNDYGNEVVNGRYDAMNGLVLLGDGAGNFKSLSLQQSGFFVPSDAKALVKLVAGKKWAVAVSQNRDLLQLFTHARSPKIVRFEKSDAVAIIYFKNGKKRKAETQYGTSFLSQSARFIATDSTMQQIEIWNNKGEKRTVPL